MTESREQEYIITVNEYFYDDNGIFISQQNTTVVKARRLEWYKKNSGKTLLNGEFFYVLDIKELK